MAAIATWRASSASSSDLTEYTFAGLAVGSGEYVFVGVGSSGATTRTVDSVTVGGGATTKLIDLPANSVRWGACFITNAVVTGPTADIVVTESGGAQRCAIQVISLAGILSPTPYDSDSDLVLSGDDLSLTIDLPARAAIIAFSSQDSGGTTAFSGVTLDNEVNAESVQWAAIGHENLTASEIGRAITSTVASNDMLFAASWGPLPAAPPPPRRTPRFYQRRF